MKVILLQDVAKTGKKFETKNVSDGYALNFLIPQKKAKVATTSALKELKSLKTKNEESVIVKQNELIESIRELKDTIINIPAKISKEGSLFAGIDKESIINAIKDQKALNINVDNIVLDKPIKESGEHKIIIQADNEEAIFKIKIVKPEE